MDGKDVSFDSCGNVRHVGQQLFLSAAYPSGMLSTVYSVRGMNLRALHDMVSGSARGDFV